MSVTDVVLENPQGDEGTIALAVNGETQLSLALENFRSIDYHFVTPIQVAKGAAVTLTVRCTEPGQPVGATSPASSCADAIFVGGEVIRPAASSRPKPDHRESEARQRSINEACPPVVTG